jgi:ATP-binding cassette subfamily B protein
MGMVASKRIFALIDDESHVETSGNLTLETLKNQIEFKNISFAYIDEDYVLKNISFTLNKGKNMALVGATGAGKSSIINLLSRFYDYQKGEILIDGIELKQYQTDSLRSHIAVVLQDVFLFSDTIFNNIRLFNDAISKEQVIEASKLVGAHNFIMKLPNNYDFVVQERGATLSTGQRQLISFIRAIIQNPKILILDEATSSVDNETEEMIQNAIEVMLKGRTSIVVAHRLSTIRQANLILVIDDGQIVQRGTHEELLSAGGVYADLYHLQFAEEKN